MKTRFLSADNNTDSKRYHQANVIRNRSKASEDDPNEVREQESYKELPAAYLLQQYIKSNCPISLKLMKRSLAHLPLIRLTKCGQPRDRWRWWWWCLHIASHRMHHCHIHCINMLWALCEINWPYSWHAQSEKEQEKAKEYGEETTAFITTWLIKLRVVDACRGSVGSSQFSIKH